ncbi:MAG: DUF937 domain-containing protein [Microbacteriaceae bacterium]|nr:DUF937 domain-containing protein [Microbacteriaceae bacterium]
MAFDLQDLLKQIPVADLAKEIGASKKETEAAVVTALPALIQGLGANAESGGADSLLAALLQHNNDLTAGKTVDLAAVDAKDGKKIVKNVFGSNEKKVVSTLAAAGEEAGAGFDIGGLIQKALPFLAPIVMSYIASNIFGGGSKAEETQSSGGLDLGGLLGGILGGGQQQSSGGLDLGGLLGGMLGGGQQQQSSGGGLDLGGLLGGVLGGSSNTQSSGGLDLGGLLGGLLGGGKK